MTSLEDEVLEAMREALPRFGVQCDALTGDGLLARPTCEAATPMEDVLRALEADEEMREWLEGIGIESLGQLAAVPRDSVATRLGRKGVALWEKACGIFAQPLQRTFPKVDLMEGNYILNILMNLELTEVIQMVIVFMLCLTYL